MKTSILKINKSRSGKLFVLLTVLITMASCNKYLDVQPKGVKLLESVTDYDQWLNNYALEASLPRELNLLSDLNDNMFISNPPLDVDGRIYIWEKQFNESVTGIAPIWSNYYQSIYLFNTVIYNVDAAENGTVQAKSSLKVEALLGRAFEYLALVNLYGKVYNPATADKDLAVPFVTALDVTDVLPSRSTVKEIYDHIIEDINTALPNLPSDNANNHFRGSKGAAYSVLARTYLYMGNYDKAAEFAQLSLTYGQNVITDYSTLQDYSQLPDLIRAPGAIYARLSSTYQIQEIPTLSFLRSFDTKDLRLKLFYDTQGDFTFTERGKAIYSPYGSVVYNAYPNWGTSASEMCLIIAEAAARSNNLPLAIQQLDALRKNRFLPADYVKFVSSNREEIIQKVLAERRFEFPFNGLRWFDMRRLDAEGRMNEVKRYDPSGALMSTLIPSSNRYTLQIPVQALYFNPKWIQNP